MTKVNSVQVISLVVSAIRDGDQVQLIDRQGRPLTNLIDRNLLGRAIKPDDSPIETSWLRAIRLRLGRLRSKAKIQSQNCPWLRKCWSLAASFRIRGLDVSRLKSRRRFENYPTKTWEAASKRLWYQGNNRRRHVQRTGWKRWSVTVSNNHNKRKGGRYAKT